MCSSDLYYVAAAHPGDMDTRSEDAILREIVREVTVGVGDTGVRAELIGEIGNTWPWTENEKKVVHAAVEAQRQTGAPLMIHPGRDQAAPMQIVELIQKQGGDLRRTVMCHIDRTIADERRLFFGLENSYYPYNPDFDMPNDGGRMAQILKLVARGHQDQILMSHDVERGAAPATQRRGRRRAQASARGESGARVRLLVMRHRARGG